MLNINRSVHGFYSIKSKLTEEIDSLDLDDRHYIKRKVDLDNWGMIR